MNAGHDDGVHEERDGLQQPDPEIDEQHDPVDRLQRVALRGRDHAPVAPPELQKRADPEPPGERPGQEVEDEAEHVQRVDALARDEEVHETDRNEEDVVDAGVEVGRRRQRRNLLPRPQHVDAEDEPHQERGRDANQHAVQLDVGVAPECLDRALRRVRVAHPVARAH